MEDQLKGASRSLGMWGILSVIFGILILAWPGITLKAFLIVLAVYLLASGFVLLVGSLLQRENHWILGAILGAISVVAGLYVFANPSISALVVLSLIAIWAVVAGTLQVVAGFEGKNNWWLILSGVVLVAFGFYIFSNPGAGALVLIWIIGLSAIISGVLSAVGAARLGALERR
jgi:uncharacterized membrane protein HdeD (DUF308 family)